MKRVISGVVFLILFTNLAFSQIIELFEDRHIDANYNDHINSTSDSIRYVYLNEAKGKNLEIVGLATQSPYTAYFIIPIAFRDQAPLWLEIDCPEMINYKFIQLSEKNVVVAATLTNSTDTINLNWTSWVLIKRNNYNDIPESVPIPELSELPDSVLRFLQPTDCVQSNDSTIRHIAETVRDSTDDLIILADRIAKYCRRIPHTFSHTPYSFDAYYALKWGNSCTGHAHAGAALFRANGVPCRVLMNMPGGSLYDMHWIVEYYIPEYGWVKLETNYGVNPYIYAYRCVISYACDIADEFSITHPENIEAYWFCSDTIFRNEYPFWGGAHSNRVCGYVGGTVSRIDQLISLTKSVFRYNTIFQGIKLNNQQLKYFNKALEYQNKALVYAKSEILDSIIYNLNETLSYYREIGENPIKEIYFNDFENGSVGWTHGGYMDRWDIGIPVVGPIYCYSGENCMGSNLDSVYSNNVNSWIKSPPIHLTDLASAYLNFKIWNDVEDDEQCENPKDRLWVELSTNNGETFFPISTCFGGVNDDPEIPSFGGWSNVVLDLSEYIDNTVIICYHFTSNDTISKTGSFIDDVKVYGRDLIWSGTEEEPSLTNALTGKSYPNPFTNRLEIEYYQPFSDDVLIEVYNLTSQVINAFNLPKQGKGKQSFILDTSNYLSGIYNIKISTCNQKVIFKVIRL